MRHSYVFGLRGLTGVRSSSFVPSHPFSFRDAPQLIFIPRILRGARSGPSSDILARFARVKKIFTCAVRGLKIVTYTLFEIRHSGVFGLSIFKILNWCQFWPSPGSPRVFLGREKIFMWIVRGLENVFSFESTRL